MAKGQRSVVVLMRIDSRVMPEEHPSTTRSEELIASPFALAV